jgi:metallo-beta-lactamase family protein
MEVTIFGAGQEVTGSCFQVMTETSTVLVDCGMFQGPARLERMNLIPRSMPVKAIDAVLITHGHLDHCGRLPLLTKAGYRGPIYATTAAADIIKLILNDAAKIAYDDTMRENRKRAYQNLPELVPLFNVNDVQMVAKLIRTVEYEEDLHVAEGISARFVDAGHILGSASIILSVRENTDVQTVAFSGDIGPRSVPLMADPSSVGDVDTVFMESTYGDRDHRSLEETVAEFENAVKSAVLAKGKVLIPTFAVGRTQLLLYFLGKMFREGQIPRIPVFLDSPMGIAATEIYRRHSNYMDDEARQWYSSGQYLNDLGTLKPCTTVEDSKALNFLEGPYIILAGAGMCNAGRILHHLRQSLGFTETVVLIVGYQAKGSLGRLLVEGAKQVRIFGDTIKVRARVHGLGGFSAHAGQEDLLNWVKALAVERKRIVLVHGEPQSVTMLAHLIHERYGAQSMLPKIGDKLRLDKTLAHGFDGGLSTVVDG